MNGHVAETGIYTELTASGQVSNRAIDLLGIFVASASGTPTIKVWDSATASGSVVVNTFTPVAGTFYPLPFKLSVGCYVTIGGTVDCTVSWVS